MIQLTRRDNSLPVVMTINCMYVAKQHLIILTGAVGVV